MNNRRRFKLSAGAGLATMLIGALMVVAPSAGAADETFPEGGVHKVGICHRTNSVMNPYVLVTVDIDAGNGSIGKGPDHYEHDGDVFDFDATDLDATYPKPRNGDQWGDIIPPVPLFDENGEFVEMSDGLNWAEGKTVYDAGCSADGGADSPVVMVKKTVPDLDVEDDFNFTVNDGEPFAVGDGDTSDEVEVPAGSVTIAEDLTDPFGYELTGVSCTRVSSESPGGAAVTVDEVDGEVTFSIEADEIVTCEFTNVPTQAGTPSVSILKTNNANGDTTYSDSEPTTAGASVPFRLVITNTGDSDVTVASLADSWGQTPALDLLSGPAGLTCTIPGEPTPTSFPLAVGTTLEPDVVVTCDFTVVGYAPSAPGALTNIVTLDTDQTEPVSDISTVTTSVIILDSSTYSVEVDKLNDANRSGRFSDDETAAAEGDAVEFQITIRNTGTGSLVLQTLTDVFGEKTVNLLDSSVGLRCPGAGNALAVGSVLAAGSTRVCTFELDGYAPPAGEEIVNTVTVDTDRADDTDTSTVGTLDVQVLPEEETPPGPPPAPPAEKPPVVVPVAQPQAPTPQVLGVQTVRALPRTGDESKGLAGAGVLLVALGAALVIGSKRQLAQR